MRQGGFPNQHKLKVALLPGQADGPDKAHVDTIGAGIEKRFSEQWLEVIKLPEVPATASDRERRAYVGRWLPPLTGLLIVNVTPEIFTGGQWRGSISEQTLRLMETCKELKLPVALLNTPTLDHGSQGVPEKVSQRIGRLEALSTIGREVGAISMGGALENVPIIALANVGRN